MRSIAFSVTFGGHDLFKSESPLTQYLNGTPSEVENSEANGSVSLKETRAGLLRVAGPFQQSKSDSFVDTSADQS